ncbi:MAG: chromosome segregation protein SMC [Bdellovibrionales bacterium]|nr:chromosome segregation protein SMC [Bdellovibrionales bacterium]
MRIKKLELIGFKSFKDRTVIHFDAGITGIVGPNGCGKSNIVDALVWVMGEMSAKDLRGSQMIDVIFAGAEGYAPMGLCEVSLTLENDGGPFPAKYLKNTEIMVTRRLHRSGEGEYFVNKEPARLKDVQEIFMDTGAGAKGFSIIQQGMIGKIITAKPEDRKHLIEEAAGITKFKARKKESQRKLQATDQNLIRLQDIIGELKRQIDSLHRQAQRAERYRNLKNQIEDLDLWLSASQYLELRKAAEQAQAIFNEAQGLEVEGESSLAGLQAELETLRLQILEKEKLVEAIQTQFYDRQSLTKSKEMEIQELKFEIEQARRNEQMTGNILQEQQARQELLTRDQAQLQGLVTELKEEFETLQAQYVEKNESFQTIQTRISVVDEDLTAKRRDLFAVGQSQASLEARTQSLSSQIEDLQERESNEQLVLNELREKKVEFEERRLKVTTDSDREKQLQIDAAAQLETSEVEKKKLTESVAQKKVEVDAFKDELNQVTSRLYGLENLHSNFEGFQEGVKQVMLWQKVKASTEVSLGNDTAGAAMPQYFQPVAEVVEVPSEYEMAMEAALGSRLQMLLATDSDRALQAVDYLKDSKLGRSSFLAATKEFQENESQDQQAYGLVQQESGVKALLKDVVRSNDQFKSSVSYLLDRVAVVDSIRTALGLRARYEGWTFVTVDGDTLTADGILTGGSLESADSGVLKRRREIKELSEKKNEWAGKLALAQVAQKKLEELLQKAVADYDLAQKRRADQVVKVAELRKDLERVEHEVANAAQACDRQDRELKKIQDLTQSQQNRFEELNQHLEEGRLRKYELETEVQELTTELQSRRDGFDTLQSQVTELQVKSAAKSQQYQGSSRQLEMVTKQVNDLVGQLSRMSEESEMYSSQMTENQILLEERKIEFERLIHEVEELKLSMGQSKDLYEQMSTRARKLEESSMVAQKAKNERQSRMNDAQLKLGQANLKEQYLVDQVREKYMLLLPDVVAKYENREGDISTAEAELKDLREKLGRIGEVNLSAIEEYDETSKRYEFLTKQHLDLTEAKEQLRRVIDRINRICSKRFKETYDQVNDRFMRVFPVLFGGGEAKLELHEDAERGEMGIEIIARPPGKKMQNVTLMSGGEKALTAVALVFSIFLVKPSPYCLLDEVDAPLDDANVFRFNDLVREMAKRSQIIVVTHNKHTMDVAGKLYGVTMQERGVSKMVSVSLQDLK